VGDALPAATNDSQVGNEIESINRSLEDSRFNGRAHSIGRARQHVDMIGFAVGVNTLAVYLHAAYWPP